LVKTLPEQSLLTSRYIHDLYFVDRIGVGFFKVIAEQRMFDGGQY
jgi:hypothetical protein